MSAGERLPRDAAPLFAALGDDTRLNLLGRLSSRGQSYITRLTAEGSVRSCLFGDDETPLAPLLRGGADDAAIATAWRAAMWGKQAGHGMDRDSFQRPIRSMGAIGG